MTPELREAVTQALGIEVTGARAVSGGDVSQAYRADLRDGGVVFVKAHADAAPGLFACEAAGLDWLADAHAIRTPEVIAYTDRDQRDPAFIVMELIEEGERRHDFDDRLGTGLAELHRAGADGFGLDHENYVGVVLQHNQARATWAEFLRDCRIDPLVRRLGEAGLLESPDRRAFDRLLDRLEDRVGPPEPPARLHGDLWSGNHLVDSRGSPCLIDPGVYGGHREMDLAMMQLFGGFGARCFAAYHEAYPLAAGVEERVALCQLYPLLVHMLAFGRRYRGQLRSTLRRLL